MTMEEIPSKPYLIRAVHEWCTDNGYTPYILVNAATDVRVPHAYVRDGQITLNVSMLATQHLALDNEQITFTARFGGVTEHVYVPICAVMAIYARETGTGMGFETVQAAGSNATAEPPGAATTSSNPRAHLNAVPPVRSAPVKPDDPTPPDPPRRPKLTIVK